MQLCGWRKTHRWFVLREGGIGPARQLKSQRMLRWVICDSLHAINIRKRLPSITTPQYCPSLVSLTQNQHKTEENDRRKIPICNIAVIKFGITVAAHQPSHIRTQRPRHKISEPFCRPTDEMGVNRFDHKVILLCRRKPFKRLFSAARICRI